MTATGNSARAHWIIGLKLLEEFGENLWLSVLFGTYKGAMVVALTEYIGGLSLHCVLPLAQIVASIINATSRCFGSALI